jgi:aminobenzoyl-glutamate transport protein
MKTKKFYSYLIVSLASAELLLALVSWILSSTTALPVRSLLSSEGIRWFLGNYSEIVYSPLLVWILLLSMLYGTIVECGIFTPSGNVRERMGRRASIAVGLLYIIGVSILIVAPHAILLSATGSLFPSPFSKALIPLIAFGGVLCAVIYGLTARSFCSLSDIVNAMLTGISKCAPLLLVYLLIMHCYESLFFVFA